MGVQETVSPGPLLPARPQAQHSIQQDEKGSVSIGVVYESEEDIAEAYRRLVGDVPPALSLKYRIHDQVGARPALQAIEAARAMALETSELEPVNVQLLQFVLCCGLNIPEGAIAHARAARLHGATAGQVLATARIAAICCGVLALNVGTHAVAVAFTEEGRTPPWPA